MFVLKAIIFCAAYMAVTCQHQAPNTTPVPILKQINRQNDDGSYSFGYEAADGSFKIETKYPNGDVAGKYGYIDETGKTREISYGASSKRGFEPQGLGIQVPPPTLNHEAKNALPEGEEDDGQYREDPSIYEDPKYNRRNQPRPAAVQQYHQSAQPAQEPAPQYQRQTVQSQYRSAPLYTQKSSFLDQAPQQFSSQNQDIRPQSQVYHQTPQFSYQGYTAQPYQNQNYQSQSQQTYQSEPAYQSQQSYQPKPAYQSQPAYQPQPAYQSQPAYQPQPAYQSQPAYQPQPSYQQQNQAYQTQNYNPFFGHPAQNFDPATGSYTINFTG